MSLRITAATAKPYYFGLEVTPPHHKLTLGLAPCKSVNACPEPVCGLIVMDELGT